jgi:hypothetical protein
MPVPDQRWISINFIDWNETIGISCLGLMIKGVTDDPPNEVTDVVHDFRSLCLAVHLYVSGRQIVMLARRQGMAARR